MGAVSAAGFNYLLLPFGELEDEKQIEGRRQTSSVLASACVSSLLRLPDADVSSNYLVRLCHNCVNSGTSAIESWCFQVYLVVSVMGQ